MGVFDELWEEYDSWYDRNREIFERELELVRRNIPASAFGLEVGVGSGRFAKELGFIGIDISENMLKAARRRGVEVVRGDALKLPFKRVFDVVLFAFTICFLDRPVEALKEARRVLVDGGIAVVCFVPEGRLAEEYRRRDSPFYREARFYTVEEVREMLHSAGFKTLREDYLDLKYGKDVALVAGFNAAGFLI